MSLIEYNIESHSHEFALWAAHRAAFRGQKGAGAKNVSRWFKTAGITANMSLPDFSGQIEEDQQIFNQQHTKWRTAMVDLKIRNLDEENKLTHGRAAKAINVYLKSRYVLTNPISYAARVIHPPIDRILLKNIHRKMPDMKNVVLKPGKSDLIAWTKLNCDQYETLIAQLREVVGEEPFWKLENYWNYGDPDNE